MQKTWGRAVTAELCWTGEDGVPAAIAVTPLLDDGSVCAALPYARARELRGLRQAGTATFSVTDSRSLGGDEAGVAISGAVTVVDDLDGEIFTGGDLLEQELVKYPPSRTLADSVLLRRENWWWLPRIVVRLESPEHETILPARTNPARHALAVRPGGAPEVRCAEIGAGESAQRPRLRDLTGAPLDDGRLLALGYDYTIPDLERWETWTRSGAITDGTLETSSETGDPDAELRPLSLLARTRRHRTLAKACRAGIRDAQNHTQPTT